MIDVTRISFYTLLPVDTFLGNLIFGLGRLIYANASILKNKELGTECKCHQSLQRDSFYLLLITIILFIQHH